MDNTTQVLAEIAQQLQVSVSHLWGTLVKQQRVNGIMEVIQIFSLGAVSLIAYLVFKRNITAFRKRIGVPSDHTVDIMDRGQLVLPCAISLLFALFFAFATIFETPNVINKFANPEYAALKDLLNATSSK
jgi:hypothetical protein